jgi:hypothetical protein
MNENLQPLAQELYDLIVKYRQKHNLQVQKIMIEDNVIEFEFLIMNKEDDLQPRYYRFGFSLKK